MQVSKSVKPFQSCMLTQGCSNLDVAYKGKYGTICHIVTLIDLTKGFFITHSYFSLAKRLLSLSTSTSSSVRRCAYSATPLTGIISTPP